MDISLNMVLKELNDIPIQCSSCDKSFSFTSVRMFSSKLRSFSPEYLYVADEDEVLNYLRSRKAEGLKDVCIMCICSLGFAERREYNGNSFVFIPQEYNFADIFTRLQNFFDRVNTWDRQMDTIILEAGGLQALVNVSEGFIENPIFSWDFSLSLQAYSHVDPETAAPSWVEFINAGGFLSGTTSMLIEKKLFTGPEYDGVTRYIPGDVLPSGHDLYSRTMFKDGLRLFSISITICNTVPDAVQLEYQEHFFDKAMEYGRRNFHDSFNFEDFHEVFIRDLIAGKSFSREELRERAAGFGISLDTNWKVILIELKEHSRSELYSIAELIRVYSVRLKVLVHEERIVVLREENRITSSSLTEDISYQRDWKNLLHLITTRRAYAAVSMVFSNFEDVGYAYIQANMALKYGKLLEGESKSIFYYDRIADYHLFEAFEHQTPLRTLCTPEMLLVWAEDRGRNKNNIELLDTYFSCDCSVVDCAVAMGLHRNSISNRLHYLMEKFRLPLDKPWGRQEIQVSLKVLKYFKVWNREDELVRCLKFIDKTALPY